jgi:hypothetical protein
MNGRVSINDILRTDKPSITVLQFKTSPHLAFNLKSTISVLNILHLTLSSVSLSDS